VISFVVNSLFTVDQSRNLFFRLLIITDQNEYITRMSDTNTPTGLGKKYHFSDIVHRVIQKLREEDDPAHQRLRQEIPHPSTHTPDIMPGFSHVSKTGVIYATTRASECGYYYGNPEWANFGQGAPEGM
jgi:hypothetical protein